MVRNEEDIVEPFVRHNLTFLDMLFVADNASTDRTREILIELQREGLPVTVFDDPIATYAQSEKMTRMLASISSTVFPDVVVPLDADEFIRCASRSEFLESLGAIPERGIGLVPWVTYVVPPFCLESELGDPPRSMIYRRREEKPQYDKVIVRLDGRSEPNLVIAQGNHGVSRTDNAEVPSVRVEGVSLGHFPVRSVDQLAAKAVIGWMAALANDPGARSSDVSYQWRDNFDAVIEKGGIPRGELPDRSMLYAQDARQIDWQVDVVNDPMPFAYDRKFSTGSRAPTMSIIAGAWEATLAEKSTFARYLTAVIEEKRRAIEAEAEGRHANASSTVLDAQWHLDDLFVDLAPFRYVFERFRPESVLDVGCGLGVYLLFLESLGANRVLGIDGVEGSRSILAEERYLQHDLSQRFHTGETYDLVICTEVAEHLKESASRPLLASLAAHAKEHILFSAADTGQPGEGHMSCKPIECWIERWEKLGWEPDTIASLSFRALSTYSWFRRNTLVLRRIGTERRNDESAFPDLCAIGRTEYRWFAQAPKAYECPFTEDSPDVGEPPGPPPAGDPPVT